MKYFIDTEFSERGYGRPIYLISIAIAAEDGRELYLVNKDFRSRHASQWIKQHVLTNLPKRDVNYYDSPRIRMESLAWKSFRDFREIIRDFVGVDYHPEFWGYFCGFDYVVLSQIMGGMAEWPKGWPYYMNDLRQWLDEQSLTIISQPEDAPHDALEDVRWIRETYLQFSQKDNVA